MTTTWLIVNIALAVVVSAIVAAAAVLVPLRLDRVVTPTPLTRTVVPAATGQRRRADQGRELAPAA